MQVDRYDLIVVGGGSGGLSCAKRAASLGASVALIEKGKLGGTCVNRGCVPKKLMWDAARALLDMRRMAEQGLCEMPRFDMARLRDLSDEKIAGLNATFEDQLADAGVTLVCGDAVIHGPDRVEIDGRRLSGDRLVLATGARPVKADIPGVDLCAISDDCFTWREVPERLVILGGGYVGCEFAAIFSALGAAVTLIEPEDRLLGSFSEPLAEHARRRLCADGVTVLTGTEPQGIKQGEAGLFVTLQDGEEVVADRVLAATGRAPDLDALGPISSTLTKAESGAIAVDHAFGTSIEGVYAVGDAADRLPLTPVATRDGEALAEQLFGTWRDQIDLDLVATTAFLFPPHAQVGRPDDAETSRSDPLRSGVTVPEGAVTDADFFALSYDGGGLIGAALAFDGAEEAIATLGALMAAGGGETALGAATGIHPTPAEEMLGR